MRIFISGCVHGCWQSVYDKVTELIEKGEHIDLIIVAGDAETMRTKEDVKAMNAPPYYLVLGTFYKFYTGELKMPCLTIVIGGNHEASDVFHALPFGGWVAENIFYTGRASSLKIGSLTLTGISGIYGNEYYYHGVTENYPIRSEDTETAVLIRAFTDFQVLGIPDSDVVITHDWPSGITRTEGRHTLMKMRRGLIRSDDEGTFGIPCGMAIAEKLHPKKWFAAHHHVKWFTKIGDTEFLAVSKPFEAYSKKKAAMLKIDPQSYDDWFELVDIDAEMGPLQYRGNWLAILKATGRFMEDPSLLRNEDWSELWSSITLETCEDTDVGAMNTDLFAHTAEFCRKHGVFCPNREIREYMETSEADA